MPCNSVSLLGTTLDCGQSGGLKAVYIIPQNEVTGITIAKGTTAGPYEDYDVVTAVTVAATKSFKEYAFRRGNATLKNATTKDVKNGTIETMTTIDLQFNKMQASTRQEMLNLLSTNSYVIAKDNNGLYWFIGYGSYCEVNKLDSESGAEKKDGNSYKITIECSNTSEPYEIELDSAGELVPTIPGVA